MQNKQYTEADWKLFRIKIVEWQENYMNKLNEEYIALLKGENTPAQKFWELHERIRHDKHKVGVVAEMRRSKLIENITSLLHEGAIKYEDLEEFSDELKETIRLFI